MIEIRKLIYSGWTSKAVELTEQKVLANYQKGLREKLKAELLSKEAAKKEKCPKLEIFYDGRIAAISGLLRELGGD